MGWNHQPENMCVIIWVVGKNNQLGMIVLGYCNCLGDRRGNRDDYLAEVIWVADSKFDVHPYLGKWSKLTRIFEMGWSHQLLIIWYHIVLECWFNFTWQTPHACAFSSTRPIHFKLEMDDGYVISMFIRPSWNALKRMPKDRLSRMLASPLVHTDGQGVFLVFPLTLLWEFTYSDFFGENALYPLRRGCAGCMHAGWDSMWRDVDREMFDAIAESLDNMNGSEITILAKLWGCPRYDFSTGKVWYVYAII